MSSRIQMPRPCVPTAGHDRQASNAEVAVGAEGQFLRQLRRPDFAHEWQNHDNTAPGEVVARLRAATIAVSNKVPILREALVQLPSLRLIAVCATGTNNVDLEYCREKKIPVCNIRHYAMHTVPEHVFALMLALRRNILAYHRDVRAGAWRHASWRRSPRARRRRDTRAPGAGCS